MNLGEYARIPIAFEVRSVFDVTQDWEIPGKFILNERPLSIPYMKDYDAIAGERPTERAKRVDVANWRMFRAQLDGEYVGGAIVAMSTPELTMLEGRDDLAVSGTFAYHPSFGVGNWYGSNPGCSNLGASQ